MASASHAVLLFLPGTKLYSRSETPVNSVQILPRLSPGLCISVASGQSFCSHRNLHKNIKKYQGFQMSAKPLSKTLPLVESGTRSTGKKVHTHTYMSCLAGGGRQDCTRTAFPTCNFADAFAHLSRGTCTWHQGLFNWPVYRHVNGQTCQTLMSW
jgi:hypothetical protein